MNGAEERFGVDLLVVGGGMAGMTAAAFAAEQGLAVLVVEKQPEIGGSARLSGGGLWTAADYETLRAVNPLGEPELARTLIDGYDAAADFIGSLGTSITERTPYVGTQSFPGVVRHIDIADYMARCRSAVQAAGGWVVTRSTITSLRSGPVGVTGGTVKGPDGEVEVEAPWTLLATGGFQNDPALRAHYLGPSAGSLAVRSNPASDGHGLKLGQAIGAATSTHMSGWYGHTIPYPVDLPLAPADFLPLAQFYLSPRGLLLDRDGRRFTDESLGYYLNAQAVATQPSARALLLFDEQLRLTDSERYGVDRFDFARRRGARVASALGWEPLGREVEAWGYRNAAAAALAFDQALTCGAETSPPRAVNRERLIKPPFFAMEVQPAITFTHGGLRIDASARVLDAAGQSIPGLLAAGADAGGTYHRAYAGGLAMAAVFGMTAARTASGKE
ncbi:MAG TPA: FAD-dependent oxidoreductase [Ramlibacter sp.]|nr:FAD-dependent oxidoreductase [Ramlibacter sp.]